MFFALFLLYVVVEVAVLVWVGSLIGVGWTVLLVLGSAALGLALFASQTRKSLTRLGLAAQGEGSATKAVADSLIVTVSGVLLFVPGLVTTVLGLLGLLPPTRGVLRPLLALAAARKLGPLGAAVTGGAAYARMRSAGGVVIEGEVVEGEVVGGGAPGQGPGPARAHHDQDPPRHLVIEPADTPSTSADGNLGGKGAD